MLEVGFLSLALLAAGPSISEAKTVRLNSQAKADAVTERLSFKEIFEASPRELKPSQKLLSLNGKRVTMVGYMAQMEMPPEGAFYLASQPVACGEGGGGTADLPPDAVLVIVRSAKGRKLEHIARRIEVTGILEVGNRASEDGQVSAIRMILDQSKGSRSPKKSKQVKPRINETSQVKSNEDGTSV